MEEFKNPFDSGNELNLEKMLDKYIPEIPIVFEMETLEERELIGKATWTEEDASPFASKETLRNGIVRIINEEEESVRAGRGRRYIHTKPYFVYAGLVHILVKWGKLILSEEDPRKEVPDNHEQKLKKSSTEMWLIWDKKENSSNFEWKIAKKEDFEKKVVEWENDWNDFFFSVQESFYELYEKTWKVPSPMEDYSDLRRRIVDFIDYAPQVKLYAKLLVALGIYSKHEYFFILSKINQVEKDALEAKEDIERSHELFEMLTPLDYKELRENMARVMRQGYYYEKHTNTLIPSLGGADYENWASEDATDTSWKHKNEVKEEIKEIAKMEEREYIFLASEMDKEVILKRAKKHLSEKRKRKNHE